VEGAAGVSPFLRTGVITAIAALIADQASKLWLLHIFDLGRKGLVSVTPFFDLVLAWNTGISYGWFQNTDALGQGVLMAVKVVAVVLLAVWMSRSQTRLAAAARPAGLWRSGGFRSFSRPDRRKNL
jgi:signal peptidase II